MADSDIAKYIIGGVLRVYAKPGKKKSGVVGYDEARRALVVEVGAPAEDNKANAELVRFLSRELGRPARIKSGFTGKSKRIVLGSPGEEK